MKVRDLGPLAVELGGRYIELGSTKQAALLAALAQNPGRRVSARLLTAVGWGVDPGVSASSLDTQLWRLRNLLEPGRSRSTSSIIVRDSGGYRLAVAAEDVDSACFERLAAEVARQGTDVDPEVALALTEEALALWRGAPFSGVAPSEHTEAVVARFEERRLELQERRVDALLRLGQLSWAVGELEPLLLHSPYRERLWAQRMTALARSGRTEEALSTYQQLRRLLDEDLGLEPGSEIKELHARILSREEPVLMPQLGGSEPVRVADIRSVRTAAVQLPRQATPIIGRESDLDRLVALVPDHPLLTVTGPGGSGKTRLAVAVAQSVSEHFVDGVWFVDLTAAKTAEDVVGIVTSTLALGASPASEPQAELVRFVSGRRVLLVLDNCEQVLDGVAECVEALLSAEPGPTLLATSREPLDVEGEIIWSLAPLALLGEADQLSPAAQLFCVRARAVSPGLELDDEQLRLVDQICHALDGLPLALELAAARVRWISLAEIAEQVLGDPAQLSRVGRSRGGHHDSLFETIDWSYRLLSEDQQLLHRALSTVPGPFTTLAAERMLRPVGIRDVPHELVVLANRSLLVVSSGANPQRSMFAQLATVRAHAHRQLVRHEEGEQARSMRDQWVEDLLSRRPRPGDPHEAAWYDDVEESYPLVRAALGAALTPQAPHRRLITAGSDLVYFWLRRSHLIEGRRWLQAACDLEPWPEDSTPSLLLRLRLANVYLLSGRPDLAEPYLSRELAVVARVPDDDLDAMIERLAVLTLAAWVSGEAQLMAACAQRVTELCQRSPSPANALLAAAMTGVRASVETAAAPDTIVQLEHVFDQARVMNDYHVQWITSSAIAALLTFRGDPASALRWLQRAILLNVQLGDGNGSVFMQGLAVNAALCGDFEDAARYFAATRTYSRRSGIDVVNPAVQPLLEATRAALGPADFERLSALGDSLTLAEVAGRLRPDMDLVVGPAVRGPASPV